MVIVLIIRSYPWCSPPPQTYGQGSWGLDFNFTGTAGGNLRQAYQPSISLRSYMQDVRWPEGDIDVFLYGCTEHTAQEKLQVCIPLNFCSAPADDTASF